MEDIKTKLTEVKRRREILENLREEKIKLETEFRVKNRGLFDNIIQLSDELNESETSVRDIAVEEYKKTGEKKLSYGIGIRVSNLFEYEEEKAFNWCMEHKMALKLDNKAFEKTLKSGALKIPEFVSEKEKVTATIPSKIDVD